MVLFKGEITMPEKKFDKLEYNKVYNKQHTKMICTAFIILLSIFIYLFLFMHL